MRLGHDVDRRSFLVTGAAAGAALMTAGLWPPRAQAEEVPGGYTLPPLPYPVEALEPHIDKETMGIHHGKHHAAYVKNLNDALKDLPDIQKLTLEQMLANKAEKVPEAARAKVINNGGGHANHALFWSILAPNPAKLSGDLDAAIKASFTSLENLQEKVNDAGMKRFGSGWAWLVKTSDGKLEVASSANQDSPLMEGKVPLLGIDVWEHAYYLKYQNRRAEYLKAIWNVVNWAEVGKRFAGK